MAPDTAPVDLSRYRTSAILKDGSTLHLRPIRPDDEQRLQDFFSRLSPHSIYLRFHQNLTHLSPEEAKRFCTVDYHNTFALVATLGEGMQERIIAVGRYSRLPKADTAIVAFVVEDAYQKKGVATHLLERLAAIAREKNIAFFQGEVLAENQAMMQIFGESGFQMTQIPDGNIYRVLIDITPSQTGEMKSEERGKVAALASLKTILQPRSIAVIGASRRHGSIGNKIFRNILQEGFNGAVYPVNPTTDVVASVKAYPTVLDIPGEVDMAVVVVPAAMVQQVIRECGQKGIHSAIIISAGFGESGAEGIERQNAVLETARSYGMRLVGPNCMGVINTAAEVKMNATFSPVFPPSGNIAFGTQSGALGLAILEYAQSLNIGLSNFVSIGNKADVSSNDLLQYWESDPATAVILLYLESFGNSSQFARIARHVSISKPIVAVKSGRTAAGTKAAASHTGAMATSEVAADALFRQTGIIRVDTLEELFDVANLLCHQPLPPGRKVAILTNGGGPGILTADACAARGLSLPDLSEKTVSGIKAILPAGSSLANPIDMTAEATAEHYRKCLNLLVADDQVDIVIVIFIPPILTQPEAVSSAIVEAAPEFRRLGKTIVASFMGLRGASLELCSREGGCVPSYGFPESTSTAIGKACDYRDWLMKPKGAIPELQGIDKDRAIEIIKDAQTKDGRARPFWLDSSDAAELFSCYGIQTVSSRTARTPEQASSFAAEIGFPVAIKLLSSSITHKTDVGGVILDLRSEEEVRHAFLKIRQRLTELDKEHEMQGVTVQAMLAEGVETIVGVTQDASSGPLILFGTGGIYTELFEDVAVRIHPLTDADAREMIRSVKAYRLLEGWRGSKPADTEALEDLLLRVSAMIEDIPQIRELDINPVKVFERGKGYTALDFRILIG